MFSRFALRRMAFALPSLLGVVILSFLLIRFIPGDPVDFVLGEQADPRDKASLRAELGLNGTLIHQFASYVDKLVHFDLGTSLHNRKPVAAEFTQRFPATFELALAALGLALLGGIPIGVFAAVRPRGWIDRASGFYSLLAMSVPGVFLGPALVYVFAMKLDWLPVSERGGIDHLLLPALSLALPLSAVVLRMTRAAMLDVVNEDFIRTARSKGASETRVFFTHALSNALTPIVTIVGLQLGALLTGTVITETIFDWPGIGTLLFNSIQRRDYPMVQGSVLMIASIYILVNAATDLAYAAVNPKIRLG